MKACGIVAEYNPFHKGHAYQIEKAKAKTGADLVIAVMSGNFLQRGEPAILDKWTRAEMALTAGIDLVVELPVLWSTQPADYFAQGALQLLSMLNIDYLSFGIEGGSTTDFMQAAAYLLENEKLISKEIKKNQVMNQSYAQKMEALILKLNPQFPLDLGSPNVQLALSYQKAIRALGKEDTIELFPIKRKAVDYREERIDSHPTIASATAIRKALLREEEVSAYLTPTSANILAQTREEQVSWADYYPYLKYQLIAKTRAELREIYQMTEGLENRLKDYIEESASFEEFMTQIKTKRYTWTRLQRLLTYVLLEIKTTDVNKAFQSDQALRILGFTKKGREYLNQQKKEIEYPIISNVNRETEKNIRPDIKAGKIYRLGNIKIKKQDFNRKPIIFD